MVNHQHHIWSLLYMQSRIIVHVYQPKYLRVSTFCLPLYVMANLSQYFVVYNVYTKSVINLKCIR